MELVASVFQCEETFRNSTTTGRILIQSGTHIIPFMPPQTPTR
jgi:hypothetical protein